MQVYDKAKIGRFLAFGGEHFVYEYEDDKVIKFSGLFFLAGKNYAFNKAKEDDYLCTKYFGNFYLATEIAVSQNNKYLAHIQLKIKGEPLQKRHLQDKAVFNQFLRVVKCNRSLEEGEMVSIDLLGRGGILKNNLSNIFVTNENELIIIDGTILSFEGILSYIPKFAINFLIWRQNKIINNFLN
jgi:hypothetical protein